MTYIAKPIIVDNHILNDVARDCLIKTEDPNKTMLRRGFKLLTEDGIVHELTFAQLDGLINILDLSRDVSGITPLQYLCQTYDLKDLIEMGEAGWVVPEYSIVVLHNAKTVRFEGLLSKGGHTDKLFSFALGDFDFIQQFSLSRVIANQHEQLDAVKGTFDMSYEYSWGVDGMRLKALEITSNEA
jgi:hypothetical protein